MNLKRAALVAALSTAGLCASAQHPQQGDLLNWIGGHVWPVTGLPRSYQVDHSYWAVAYSNDYLGYDTAVHDPSRIQERFITQYGLNLYDGAMHQLALSLAGGPAGRERAAYHTRRLHTQRTAQFASTRGHTQTNYDGRVVYQYGDGRTNFWKADERKSLFFRMVSELYSEYDPYLYAIEGPSAPYVIWQDWKPVVGENAWCGFIGPLQTAYLQHNTWIPWTDPALQLAMDMVQGLAALQNEIGAFYHVPTGVAGKDPSEISNENNISVHAALRLFLEVLDHHLGTGSLLKNDSFEAQGNYGPGSALHWTQGDPDLLGGSWGSASRENWRAHSGGWMGALRGTWASAGDYGGWWQQAPTRPGLTNTASAWFWADHDWSAAEQSLKIEFYNADYYLLGVVTNDIGPIGENWELRSLTAAAPFDAVWARAVVGVSGAGPSGALQVDDLQITASPMPDFGGTRTLVTGMLARLDAYFDQYTYNPVDGVFFTGGNYDYTNHTFTPYKFNGYWIGGPYKGAQPFSGASSSPVHTYAGTNEYTGNDSVRITLAISPDPGQVNLLFPPHIAEYPMTAVSPGVYTYLVPNISPGMTLKTQFHPIGGLNGPEHEWVVAITDPPRPFYTETTNLFAVDCQTWIMAALGAERVDAIVGYEGAAWDIWQNTKDYGGYVHTNSPGVIRGVGFSDVNNASNDVFSAEWTFGAILMCRNLARDYHALGRTDLARRFEDDAHTMRTACEELLLPVTNIVTETLANGQFTYDLNWWQYTTKITNLSSGAAYAYANKRYEIPFGWWANRLPSLASTAWAILIDQWFDPFVLGGRDHARGRLEPGVRLTPGATPGTVNVESRSGRVGRPCRLEQTAQLGAGSWSNYQDAVTMTLWPYVWSNVPAAGAHAQFRLQQEN